MEIPNSEHIFRVILNVLINVLILASNAIVLLAFWRYKSLRSIPHLFILNLAITDFLLGLFVVPFITAAVVNERWTCGEFFCNFQGAVTTIVTVASVFTLTFVSLERKLAICNPWYHYVWFNSRKVTYLFVVIWLICCLLAAMGFLSSKYVFKDQFMMCMINWNETLWITIYAVTIHFFLPFLLLVYSNLAIIKVLRDRRRIMNSMSSRRRSQGTSAQTRRVNREKKAWKLLLTVVLVFVLCWAPYYCSVVCSTLFGDDCAIPKRIYFYFVVCAGLNSCINPFIYVVMNNSFRQAFFRLFHINVPLRKNEPKPDGGESSGKRTFFEVKAEFVDVSMEHTKPE